MVMFVAFQQDIQRISILFDAQQHAKQPANTLIFHTTYWFSPPKNRIVHRKVKPPSRQVLLVGYKPTKEIVTSP